MTYYEETFISDDLRETLVHWEIFRMWTSLYDFFTRITDFGLSWKSAMNRMGGLSV